MNTTSFNEYVCDYLHDTNIFKNQKYMGHAHGLNELLIFRYNNNFILLLKLFDSYTNVKFNRYFTNNNYNYYIDKLNEGIVTTYSPDVYIDKIKTLGLKEYDSYFLNNNNALSPIIEDIFYLDDYIRNEYKIKLYIKKCGYFISDTYKESFNNVNIIHVLTEPLFINECTDLVYNRYNGIIYHITLSAYFDKISNIGLLPKNHNKKVVHPERVYCYPIKLSLNNFKLEAESLFKEKCNYRNRYSMFIEKDKGLSITVLKLNLNKYDNIHYRFFWDPNNRNGIFTYEPIHPKCIEKCMKFYI